MPKQGAGNTNTGNIARKAFDEAEIFSNITGVSQILIEKLRNIIKAVNSGYPLNIENFKKYCFATSEFIVEEYGWYTIPPTVHKLLEHGYQIQSVLELPIGMYSEEAQEAANKIVRNARLNNTFKKSRMNVMENQYHHCLLRSDPVISSASFMQSKTAAKNTLEELDDEVLELLDLTSMHDY